MWAYTGSVAHEAFRSVKDTNELKDAVIWMLALVLPYAFVFFVADLAKRTPIWVPAVPAVAYFLYRFLVAYFGRIEAFRIHRTEKGVRLCAAADAMVDLARSPPPNSVTDAETLIAGERRVNRLLAELDEYITPVERIEVKSLRPAALPPMDGTNYNGRTLYENQSAWATLQTVLISWATAEERFPRGG